MTRKELKEKIETMSVIIEEKSDLTERLSTDRDKLVLKLKNLNKPKLSSSAVSILQEIIEESICETDWIDTDDCEYELSLDYDNRVCVSGFNITRAHEVIVQAILDSIESKFQIEEDGEEIDFKNTLDKLC